MSKLDRLQEMSGPGSQCMWNLQRWRPPSGLCSSREQPGGAVSRHAFRNTVCELTKLPITAPRLKMTQNQEMNLPLSFSGG
jgi:hypothetical protein